MKRIEVIKKIRAGLAIYYTFDSNYYGLDNNLTVSLYYHKDCNMARHKMIDHQNIGPIHMDFFSGSVRTIHVSPKQVLNFIRRNYPK